MCMSGPPCVPGKIALSIAFAQLLAAEDHAAARSAQRLVRRGGHDVGIRHRVWMQSRRDKSRDVRHVYHEVGADLLGDGCDIFQNRSMRG